MAYELAAMEAFAPAPSQQVAVREEKVLDTFDNTQMRIAKAREKIAAQTSQKNDVVNTIDNVDVESSTAFEVSRPLSPQLAALARKEQKFREEQRKFKASEQALETERKELAELKELKAKLLAGDYSSVEKFVDYEKFAQHKIGKDPKAEELELLRSDIAKLKADQEKDINDRFESAVNQRRVAVKTLIATDTGEQFKAIKHKKAEDAVVQHILDTWENDGEELTPEQAAKEVETALREKAQEWAQIFGEQKAVAAEEEVPSPQAADKKELPPLKTGMKTLTNNMASIGQIKPQAKPLHLMSEHERYQEARRRYEEKLKQGMR